MPPSVFGVGLVERAVDLVVEHLRDQLSGYIDQVYVDEGDTLINLPKVQPDSFYISDGVHPLTPPAVFVVAEGSDHDLEAQNFAAQSHRIFVALVAEEIELQRMQRKVWRYGKALWLALHDQDLGDIKILVRGLDYGPTVPYVAESGGQRSFRKDVTLRCDVLHYERFR